MNMSLTEPNLLFLARSLSPAVLRIGGSQGDLVVYETPNSPCPPNTTFCLTMARWAEINEFAAATDLHIAFGLNAMAGRLNKTCPLCPWDSTNTADFLAYTAAQNWTTLKYLEFGNELTPFVASKTYAADLKVLRAVVDRAFPDAASRPKLVANDANPDAGYLRDILSISGGAIDVATWHMYVGYGLDPNLSREAWNATFLDKIRSISGDIVAAVASAPQFSGALWVGESALAWHSGREGVTDTFLSSAWWLSALGGLAPTHDGFCRQTLIGGNYELMNKTTRAPNPDYYVARLFKDAMGARVLAAASSSASVHAFAQCNDGGNGGVTVAWINFGDADVAARVDGVGAPAPRAERTVTRASPGDDATIALNGNLLAYTPGSNTLPSLAPKLVNDPAAPVVLPAHSLGFTTFFDATIC
jgi:heparanase 1